MTLHNNIIEVVSCIRGWFSLINMHTLFAFWTCVCVCGVYHIWYYIPLRLVCKKFLVDKVSTLTLRQPWKTIAHSSRFVLKVTWTKPLVLLFNSAYIYTVYTYIHHIITCLFKCTQDFQIYERVTGTKHSYSVMIFLIKCNLNLPVNRLSVKLSSFRSLQQTPGRIGRERNQTFY